MGSGYDAGAGSRLRFAIVAVVGLAGGFGLGLGTGLSMRSDLAGAAAPACPLAFRHPSNAAAVSSHAEPPQGRLAPHAGEPAAGAGVAAPVVAEVATAGWGSTVQLPVCAFCRLGCGVGDGMA